MKLLKMSLLLLIIGANFQTAEAQFFKKLKEKVAKFAENSGGPNNYYAAFLDDNTTGRFTIDLDTTWRATVRGANYSEYNYSGYRSKIAKVHFFYKPPYQRYLIEAMSGIVVRVKYGDDRRIENDELSLEEDDLFWFFKKKSEAEAFLARQSKRDSLFQKVKSFTNIFKNERDNRLAAEKAAKEAAKAKEDSARAVYDAKQRADALANNRLPEKGLKDSKLEADAKNAAKRSYLVTHGTNQIVRAYFYGNSWSTLRNRYTGVITGRTIDGVVLYKKPNGDCRYLSVVFAQEYNGVNYTNMVVRGIDQYRGGGLIDCKYFK